MRRALVLSLILLALGASFAVAADPASISRDARGDQPSGMYGPLGSPTTPALYLLSQETLFIVGLVLLAVAAVLGAYTMMTARRAVPPTH
jgi:hypothetical protein